MAVPPRSCAELSSVGLRGCKGSGCRGRVWGAPWARVLLCGGIREQGMCRGFLTKSRSVTGENKKETKQSPARETVLLSAPTRTCALLSGTAVKLQGKQRWYFAMVGERWGLGHAVGGIRVWLLCEQGLQNRGSDMPRTMRAER